jgi:hypothetical protein
MEDTMALELNREYPQENEEQIFAEMVDEAISEMKAIGGFIRRGQHAKATGCVTAEFRVVDEVPDHLRHGVFAEPGRSFEALARFSNSQGTLEHDGEGTGRGMAIKLLNVSGVRAIRGDADSSQDFLMVNHPIFPFPNPVSYLDIIKRKNFPIVGGFLVAAHLKLHEPDQLAIIKDIKDNKIASPLEITYWSGSPYWLGHADGSVGQAVKYSAVPRAAPSPLPEDPEDLAANYLSEALAARLRDGEAVFDFKIQIQTHATKMPIEDASVEWDEAKSLPVSVATLRIPSQRVKPLNESASECESLSFNPWHALAAHRPMGGINRLRRAVYEASVRHRSI